MSLTTWAILILGLWVIAIVVAGLVMTLRPGGVGVKLTGATAAPVPGDQGLNRQEIPLGGNAEVFGNVRGSVVAVLMQPDTRQLLGIQLGGMLETETVPAGAVLAADGNTTTLADGWQDHADNLPTGAAVLKDNMAVVDAAGKRLGRLRVVCYEPSGRVTGVVFEGRGIADRRLVPIDQVVEAGPDRIATNLRASDAGTLSVFATDWELRQAILERLAQDPALEPLQRSLRIEVRDQRVRLQGYVSDRSKAEEVERAVRGVPGVLRLDAELPTDDQLAQAVRDALRRDPTTSAVQAHVSVRSGVVDITGEAPDRATVRRIDAVTQQVEGPQVIHNMVVVRPTSAQPAAR